MAPIPRAKGVEGGMLAAIMAKVDEMRSDMSELRDSQTFLSSELNMLRKNDGGDDRDYSMVGYSGASSGRADMRGHRYRSSVGNSGGREPKCRDRHHHGYEGYGGYDKDAYESRYHGDGLDRGSRRERVPRPHEEPRSRRARDQELPKGYVWPKEEEVSSRARRSSNSRYGGGDTNQTCTPSSCMSKSYSFHSSKVPLDVCPDISSSMSLSQRSGRKERERGKRLESVRDLKKPRECEKRLKGEVQKSRESGGGERKDKHQMREKPQAQVSKGCLLDSKTNLGWALDDPLPLSLGEEYNPLPTNTSCISFCVDDFVVKKIEDKEVKHHGAHGLETSLPVMDQEEQGQVEELLARGSIVLTCLPVDASMKCLIVHDRMTSLDMFNKLNEKVFCKNDLSHVYPNVFVDHEFLNSRMMHENMDDFKMPMGVESFIIDALGDRWQYDLEHLNAKSTIASYSDPFLGNSCIDKHAISFVHTSIESGISHLGEKMNRFTKIDVKVEPNIFLDENGRAKMFKVFDACVSWHDRCFYCMTIKPFNGIAIFYGLFVKDFSTDAYIVNLTMCDLLYFSFKLGVIVYICVKSFVLPFDMVVRFEKLTPFNSSSAKMLVPCDYKRGNDDGVEGCQNATHGVNLAPNNGKCVISFNVKISDLVYFLVIGTLVRDLRTNPSKDREDDANTDVRRQGYVYFDDDGEQASILLSRAYLATCELGFGILDTLGKHGSFCTTMIFDLDLLGFVGMRDRDLRTNPSKEGGNDVNPGVQHHIIHRLRGPWIDWGPRRGQSHANEISCSWSRIQRLIGLII